MKPRPVFDFSANAVNAHQTLKCARMVAWVISPRLERLKTSGSMRGTTAAKKTLPNLPRMVLGH